MQQTPVDLEPSNNRHLVVRMLIIGFSLVLLVVGLAVFVVVRDQALRADTSQLVKDHLGYARLLHEVQVQQDLLAFTLHRIETASDIDDRKRYSSDLRSANDAIQSIAREVKQTPHADEWLQVSLISQRFTDLSIAVLENRLSDSPQLMDQLFSEHDHFVKLIHNLIQQNTENWESADQKMNLQFSDLKNKTVAILVVSFILAILFAGITIMIVRININRIEWQRDELNRVSWQMLQTQEETARRFSHELHDELGQSLAAIRSNLTKPSELDQERQADCLQLVDEAIANVRELSQLLRPVILDDFGLEVSLQWLAERFSQRSHIKVIIESTLTQRPTPEIETHVFRIAQEAFTNIARHSQATLVRMSIKNQGNELFFEIEDNGIGITKSPSEKRSSLGLISMRARARECNGILHLTKAQPHGLTITLRLPIAKA
jgi:signal transduction histidine kinase